MPRLLCRVSRHYSWKTDIGKKLPDNVPYMYIWYVSIRICVFKIKTGTLLTKSIRSSGLTFKHHDIHSYSPPSFPSFFYFISVVYPERHTIAADQPAFNGRLSLVLRALRSSRSRGGSASPHRCVPPSRGVSNHFLASQLDREIVPHAGQTGDLPEVVPSRSPPSISRNGCSALAPRGTAAEAPVTLSALRCLACRSPPCTSRADAAPTKPPGDAKDRTCLMHASSPVHLPACTPSRARFRSQRREGFEPPVLLPHPTSLTPLPASFLKARKRHQISNLHVPTPNHFSSNPIHSRFPPSAPPPGVPSVCVCVCADLSCWL